MTSARIKEKVMGFIHGKDGKGNLILPWEHNACCVPCNQLIEFIEGLFKEDELGFGSSTMEKAEEANKDFSHALNVYIDSLYCSEFETGVTPKPSKLTKTNVTVVIDSRLPHKWKHFKFKG